MRLICEHNGLQVYAHGSEVNNKFKASKPVAVPESMVNKMAKTRQTTQGDSVMFEKVFESENMTVTNPSYDYRSLADFFPVDRRSGFATSLKLNMQRRIAPQIATQVCCATDIPIISVDKRVFSSYVGFVNLAVAADVCTWDRLAAAEDGINLVDDDYLPAINEALTVGANLIALEGDNENNVMGLKNNPWIPTVVVDPLSVTNPVISFRKIVQFLETRNNSIIELNGAFTKQYTLFLPLSIVISLCNTYVTFADAQISLMSMLAGLAGVNAQDPSVPKFRIIGLNHLEKLWADGVSSVGYLFASGTNDFNSLARWWKPFSFLELGNERKGLREQSFYGARVGSIEFLDLSKVIRIIIPPG